jgi:3-oxoacyl-[acyl-carrier protein] reductase
MINNKSNILITGGAGGIGYEVATTLKDKVNSIGIIDNNSEKLSKINNPNFLLYNVDISNFDDLKNAVDDYYINNGTIDCLINCAAILVDKPLISISIKNKSLSRLSLESWDEVIKTNLYGTYYASIEVAEKMIKSRTKGVIVNVGSISSGGNIGQSSYAASKGAINALTVTWAQELSNFGIRVNAVAPGMTSTDMPLSAMTKEHLDQWKNKIPLKRFAQPSEIADAIIFCINNKYMNGRVLEIDGGLRM